MADSTMILIIYTCTSPIYSIVGFIVVATILYFALLILGILICLPFQKFWKLLELLSYNFEICYERLISPCLRICDNLISMSRYLAINTLIMASLHTFQVYGLEDDESLLVNSFNICENTTATGNNGEVNYINSHKTLFIGIIWSAVFVALIHLIIEAKYATRKEQVFFGTFILTQNKIHLSGT